MKRALPLLGRAGAAATLILMACGGPGFDKALTLGGKLVQPATLNRGRDLFNRYCATCHGYDGKADTAQARQLDPRPRDLTLADFKRVASPGQLPTDNELSTTILNGVPGTGMPAWPQLAGDDLECVIQYLKTFSQRWASDTREPAKKTDDGAMNVLPVSRDAASFRAAHQAGAAEGSAAGPEARMTLCAPADTVTEAACVPPAHTPQVAH